MALNGKLAIISGGSRGIGRSIVLELVKKGCNVVFTYKSKREQAEDVILQCKNYEGQAEAFCVDVSENAIVKNFIKEIINTKKNIDIVINNAGIRKDKTLPFLTDDDWNDVIKTNLTGVFNLTRACIPYLLKRRSGRIINISSISGLIGIVGQTNYSSSKAGIIGFTRALAKEVAPYGISVNVITPGGIETEMVKSLPQQKIDELIKNVPMNRLGQPEEVAKVVSFLADPELCPSFLTGSIISIDGGGNS